MFSLSHKSFDSSCGVGIFMSLLAAFSIQPHGGEYIINEVILLRHTVCPVEG